MIPGYYINEELAADERYRLCRGRRERDRGAVLIKVPLGQPAPAADIAALAREFEILNTLLSDIEGIPRAHELIHGDGDCALVLEDMGGIPLAALYSSNPPPLGQVLDIAIQLVAILAELHRRGVIHRNINPRALLIDARSGRVQLTDLASAARDAAEASAPIPRGQYRTRLPYAAPEQTGRMNRGTDYRADFYSLGVTLYELLTRRRPFGSDDPLELIHAHIAKVPLAPSDLDPAIPLPVSRIVMKLLAKTAEERYQSALGLKADLERCRREWSEHGQIPAFPIASRDVPERFTIPQRLYGRERELARMLCAFERACQGASALLLVAGYAGIGKTALIQELYKPIARGHGYFIGGKFDQLSRDIPYGALIQAFQQLVQRLLTEEPGRLARWRAQLAEALGRNAGVIAEVIPEIELILGKQAAAPPLPPAEAQNRFILVFQNFLSALSAPEHPLAVFLDDLQWVDSATLQLLEPLLASPRIRGLFLIGAYRDNEVGPDHPLMKTVAALEESGVSLHRMTLPPLGLPELRQLTADALHVPRKDAEPLAALLLAKTDGNPFFVIQFLKTLYQDGLIVFDVEQSRWSCRIDTIASAAMTDNVVDLMSRRINRLAPATQRVITLAACVGNRFDLETLATVSEQSPEATLQDLAEAVAEGLIVPEADNAFVFLHDRVQQAAYARIPDARKPQVHLSVGRLLLKKWPRERAEEEIFDIASHLNMGAQLIGSQQEKLALARVNLAAGRKAKLSTAHKAALGYFAAGIGLLDEDRWQSDYELAFALSLEAAQCEYLCGDFDAAEREFAALLGRAATSLDKARVYSLRMVQYENMSRYADALANAREGLALFGVSFPDSGDEKQAALDAEVDSIQSLIGPRAIESLIDLPAMTDPEMRMVMSILTDIWSSAYILGDATLARLISATMVRLSLLHGNSAESAYGYVTHAITVGPVREDYESAYEFGSLALRVNERFNDSRRRAKIHQQFHAHVNLWRRPMQTCIPYAQEACRSGLETGDFLYAAYGASTESWPAIVSTQDLAQFVRDFTPNLALIKKLKIVSFADSLQMIMNWARALQAETESPVSLSDESFNENEYIETYRGNPFFTMFHAIAKLHLFYVFGEYGKALETARIARGIAHRLTGMIWTVLFDFWNGLTLAANYADATEDERRAYLEEMEEAQKSFAVLAQNCPENFLCQSLLLSAEIERIAGRQLPALDFYERALSYADETKMIQHQALANELFARFWLERGNRKIASLYLREALERYAQWGAHAKQRSLVERYGELLGRGATGAMDSSAGLKHETLDLSTIVKAAHAISENIELEEFLKQMLMIAIENAGARRGVLIEEREGELFIAAEGAADSNEAALLRNVPLGSGAPRCASAVVNYVYRTKGSLVIADAALDERFAQDGYVATTQPKSILCLPIVHQGKLSAILYLENNLIRDAFSAGRIEVMQILSAQAAISLENARLFDRMKQEIAQRQHAEEGLKRALSERKRSEEMLRSIAEGTASVTGAEFFHSLVRHLASALQVRYAFVAECFVNECQGEQKKCARSRAFWKADGFGENFEYEVPGTPCMEVLNGQICHHAAHVQELFPDDKDLVALGAESYIGAPLVGASGEVIGHVAILDTKPIDEACVGISVLKVFAGRAGAELERLKADEGLKRALAELERLKNQLQEENVYLRSELIANVSHDLRTPIALMRGYLETLLMKEESLTHEKRRSYLEIATRQSEHLATLIDELFELAKLDFRGYEINAEPVHLGELAQDVLQKFQLAAEKKEIALEAHISPGVGFVRADIGLIERALENLLENALRHTRSGGRIGVTVFPLNGQIVVRVSDTGTGIPPEELAHIFERFYRVDKSRTSRSGGAGLGLAIVKRILDLHDSEISVESTLMAGTAFSFGLPAAAWVPNVGIAT